MTERPIDPSTGKPRAQSDAEAYDEIRAQHSDSWRGRDGEKVRVFMTRSGLTTLGKVWRRGEALEVEVGSDEWIATLEPQSGKSMLELNAAEQIGRWGARYYVDAAHGEIATEDTPTPFDDDRPHRPSATQMPKGEAAAYAAMRAAWAEQEALRDEPVRQVSAETRIPKGTTE